MEAITACSTIIFIDLIPICHERNAITKDFNGLPIVFREDGYINMTKAAKHFGKRLQDFFDNAETKAYLIALNKLTPISVNFREATKGRNGETFGHPKLAVKFARWLSVEFEVWCDLMIDNILQGNIQTTVVVRTAEAVAGLHHKSDIWSQPFADSQK